MAGHALLRWIVTIVLVCPLECHLDRNNKRLMETLKYIVREESQFSEARAEDFLKNFNFELKEVNHRLALAEYEYNTDLRQENADKFTAVSVEADAFTNAAAQKAKRFLKDKVKDDFEDPSVYRMLKLMTCSSTSSKDESVNKRISELVNELSQIYGTTLIEGRTLDEVEVLMGTASSQDRLRYWLKWRNEVGPKMKPLYTQLISNLNLAARENGFSDIGEPWRAGDFGYETDDLESMAADLFEDIKPLYLELHAFVRRRLYNMFPEAKIDLEGPIPAHLLGNMWAQQWYLHGYRPYPDEPQVDITPKLEQEYTVDGMFRLAEAFFSSIGLENMTETFWEKSMRTRPENRDVQCHASATDLFKEGDFRIKMCTKRNQEDLTVIHHEMGHIEYFMEYADQPAIFRTGANAAFHEAIGDTIALSVNTATHFEAIGLLDSFTQNSKSDINLLFDMALQKVAFLPFGYLIDLYRWEVFRGTVDESNYNAKWWKLRRDIQGISPPVERTEEYFDPGAKYHVAANVPYIRYFFAHIAQFQFYEAMCKASGHTGPIHRCDFYQSKDAGKLLKSMLKLGQSEEWQVAMRKMTGIKEFSVRPLLNYFEPLHKWLIAENEKNNEFIGWK